MEQKILMVIPNTPLPHLGGGSLRMFHMIRHLGQHFKVDLVGAATTELEQAEQVCRQWCNDVELVEPTRKSRDFSRLHFGPYERDSILEEKIRRRLSIHNYVGVHVEKPAMLPYIPPQIRLPIILDVWSYGLSGPWRNFRYQAGLASRCRSLIQMTRLGLFDLFCWPTTHCIVVVSEEDRVRCQRAHPGARVLVVPNGVDCDAMQPKRITATDPPIILFSGDMSFSPNIDAAHVLAEKIFPSIRHQHPGAKLLLVGRKPVDSIRSLQGADITVTGEVKDMQTYLHQASVYVAPHFTGAGTRTKLLEAMGVGLPIVTTSVGIEGIAAVNQRDVRIADTLPQLQAAILFLLEHPGERIRMGEAARMLAERRYDWKKCLKPLESLYGSLLAKQVA